MTLLGMVRERCAVCDALNVHKALLSTNSYAADLDGRPIGMARGTIYLWVHQCHRCGYCASALNELLPEAKQTVYSEPFQQLQASRQYPDLAKRFLSLSLIQENAGHYYQASYSALCAAWAGDDKKQSEAATACRQQAITLLKKSRSLAYQDCPTPPYDDDGTNEVILADMLRRTSAFEEARRIIEEGQLKKPSDRIAQMLDYELRLVEKRDSARHTAEEVFNPNLPTPFEERMGCLIQLVIVGAYFALMLYFVTNYPEKAELIIFGGIFLALLILVALNQIDVAYGRNRRRPAR